jgi:hypothetical protein
MVARGGKIQAQTINRVLFIAKSRNGRGAGTKIGYHFDHQTMTFTEAGIIAGSSKGHEPPKHKPTNHTGASDRGAPQESEDVFQ